MAGEACNVRRLLTPHPPLHCSSCPSIPLPFFPSYLFLVILADFTVFVAAFFTGNVVAVGKAIVVAVCVVFVVAVDMAIVVASRRYHCRGLSWLSLL